MNKYKIRSILVTIALFLTCVLLVNYIFFRFVASYSYNEERLNARACEMYGKANNKVLIQPLNSFMYEEKKLYSCAINDIYEKVIVLNEKGDLLLEGNYQSMLTQMELTGANKVGIYKNQLVIVKKNVEDLLDIIYYDARTGKEVFSLQTKEE